MLNFIFFKKGPKEPILEKMKVSHTLGPKVEEKEGGKIVGKVMSVGLMRVSDMTQNLLIPN